MSATPVSDAKVSLAPWIETRGIRTLVKVRTVSMTVLAKGGSADVYKARWRGQWVVRKIFRGDPKMNQKRLRRELENWRLVHHPHVQELLGIHWTGEVPALVSPFYEFTSLHAYIQYCLCYMADIFVNRLKAELLCQVLRGLGYLHEHPCRPMVHGDIKASNIFVTKNGIAVVGDFGTCRAVTPHRTEAISRPWPYCAPVDGISPDSTFSSASSLNLNGTLRWMAPELVIDVDPLHTVRTDIWAFGCLILEIMSGEAPFSGCNDGQVVLALSNRTPPPRPQGLTELVWRVIKYCCRGDVSKRPRNVARVQSACRRFGWFPLAHETAADSPCPREMSLCPTLSLSSQTVPQFRHTYCLSTADSSVLEVPRQLSTVRYSWSNETPEEEDYMLKEQKKIREEIRSLEAKLRKLNATVIRNWGSPSTP